MVWRRKSETDEALHESIMMATARAIVKHGVADLTVRDIGSEFDRSRSLINYHYDSKEALLETFVEYTVDRYSGTMSFDPEQEPDVQLDRFVRQALFGLEGADDSEDHWTLIAAQYALRPEAMANERIRTALTTGFDEIHRTLSEIVAAGIEQGVVDASDSDTVTNLLLGIIDSARGGKVILGNDDAPERMYLALTRLVYPALGIEPSARR
ncbi:MAG: TetR/AcrR family transcriptional regulator [Halobacteriales archaeon]|nr:TetR/AcrR family transcriptional regulator [Halobacteriales archaeon]